MQNNSIPLRISQGDRFISQWALDDEISLTYSTKVELFSHDRMEDEAEERRTNQ